MTDAFATQIADVHRMLAREFSLLPDIVLAVAAGDVDSAHDIGSWAWEVLDALHHYRHAQVETLWPILRHRMAPDDAAGVVVTHAEDLLGSLDQPREIAQAAALRWQADGDLTDRDVCATTMASMRAPLADALLLVENRLATIIDAHLTPDERAALARATWLDARGARQREILAAVLEESRTPELVLAAAPMVLRWLVGPLVVEPHMRRMTIVRQRGPVD